MIDTLLLHAERMQDRLIAHRRYLHAHAEVGFALRDTTAYVGEQLEHLGCRPVPCGRAGVTACIGSGRGRTVLLRADMDALPIREEADVPFAAKNGNMHACGHDMHTAMLLGAAELLKAEEDSLCGTVKLLFQAAEETLEGAPDAIENGILESPSVDFAIMLHVLTDVPYPCGTVILPAAGVGAPAADFFRATVRGSGCHGSTPEKGIDPLIALAHALIALENIHARELSASSTAVLTVGSFHGGDAANAIAERAVLEGSLRTFSDEERAFLHTRLESIFRDISAAFRCDCEVSYPSGCPTLQNDAELVEAARTALGKLLPQDRLHIRETLPTSGGSEDFSYISQRVPSLMLALSAGSSADGYRHPQHHPKARFDEAALPAGAAAYACLAQHLLKN